MQGSKGFLALCALVVLQSHALAQTAKWPQRPVRVVVPLAPGGSVDMVARLLATRLTEQLGQQFIDYLVSAEGQKAIENYKIDGQQLFYPNANDAGA